MSTKTKLNGNVGATLEAYAALTDEQRARIGEVTDQMEAKAVKLADDAFETVAKGLLPDAEALMALPEVQSLHATSTAQNEAESVTLAAFQALGVALFRRMADANPTGALALLRTAGALADRIRTQSEVTAAEADDVGRASGGLLFRQPGRGES